MRTAELIRDIQATGVTIEAAGDKLIVRPAGRLPEPFRVLIREHKPDILRELARPDPDRLTLEADDLREHFTERAAILEYDAGLSRAQAELEAARMTAALARNRSYSWGALRAAMAACPALQAGILDRSGVVDSLPLGVAKLAIHPKRGVMPQGRHAAKVAAWQK